METAPDGPPEFGAEFDHLFGRAFAVARRLTPNDAAAEDVAAEALARTYVHWHRVRRYEYRDAWVARVATNRAARGSAGHPIRKIRVL